MVEDEVAQTYIYSILYKLCIHHSAKTLKPVTGFKNQETHVKTEAPVWVKSF